VTSQAAVVNTIKEWQIFDVPYLFDSVDQANRALRSETGRKLLDLVDRQGMVGLSWLSILERDVVSAKKPVMKLADLDGFKIRVMQSPGFVKAYKTLGANPVPLPYGQLYLALQQGVVDGAESSPELMIQDKFAEVSKHFVLSHVNHMPVALLMSKRHSPSSTRRHRPRSAMLRLKPLRCTSPLIISSTTTAGHRKHIVHK
jgi:TRAP-type C4-dicarboxylate transport system substrate-binding protein